MKRGKELYAVDAAGDGRWEKTRGTLNEWYRWRLTDGPCFQMYSSDFYRRLFVQDSSQAHRTTTVQPSDYAPSGIKSRESQHVTDLFRTCKVNRHSRREHKSKAKRAQDLITRALCVCGIIVVRSTMTR